jgi:hypothetical protein
MANDRSKYADKVGRDRAGQGSGVQVSGVPEFSPIAFKTFQGGYYSADAPQDLPDGVSPDMTDMITTVRDSLRKAAGTAEEEVFDVRTPTQMALHVGAAMRSELVMFDPPYMGFKRVQQDTRWVTVPTLNAGDTTRWAWAVYSDVIVMGNGFGRVYSHVWGTDEVTHEELIPPGNSFAVFAARLFIGAPKIEGTRARMGVAWSGIEGYNKFDFVSDQGSGFEELISEAAAGDEVVSVRSVGLDLLALLSRKRPMCSDCDWWGNLLVYERGRVFQRKRLGEHQRSDQLGAAADQRGPAGQVQRDFQSVDSALYASHSNCNVPFRSALEEVVQEVAGSVRFSAVPVWCGDDFVGSAGRLMVRSVR